MTIHLQLTLLDQLVDDGVLIRAATRQVHTFQSDDLVSIATAAIQLTIAGHLDDGVLVASTSGQEDVRPRHGADHVEDGQ